MITPVAPSTSNINDRLQCRRQKKAEESGATAATTTPMAAAKPSVINAWISMMSSCRHNSSTDGTVSENERQLGGSNREVFSSRCTLGPMAIGPNPVGGEPRSKQPQG